MAKMRTLDEVIGAEIARRREAAGLRQDDLVQRARRAGLDWQQPTVSAIEAGRRQISLGEAIALAAVLRNDADPLVGTPDLLPSRDEWVELADNVVGWLPAARLILGGGRGPDLPPNAPTTVIHPDQAIPAIDEADRKASRALSVTPVAVAAAAARLWGHSLAEERDRLIGDAAATPQKRGRVTRQLLKELKSIVRQRKRRKTNG
jgi:transcriptional regulator with XRE-family HTH domain